MSHAALIGEQAPSLSLPNYTGKTYSLTPGESGNPIVLFFYPSSEKDTFKPGKVQIIGLSPDPVDKQKRFFEKEKLTYLVLSDVNGDAAKSDTLDATINYGAHSKFVAKWLDKLEAEYASADQPEAGSTPPQVAE
ncbi:hypothetical protein J132_03627 [Termitomyces sp. J132]|nr:hypothetical protein J132_03627 [Termitomyces sp. J132]